MKDTHTIESNAVGDVPNLRETSMFSLAAAMDIRRSRPNGSFPVRDLCPPN